MVNLQDTSSAGLISAADLDAARKHSTGNVWLMPRRQTLLHCPPCNGDCANGECVGTVPGRDTCNGSCQSATGCECWRDTVPTDWRGLDACAPEGGRFMEPAPAMESMLRHRRTRSTVALAALLAVAGFAAHLIWPLA